MSLLKPPVETVQGGTGQITLTNHGLLVGAGTASITQLPAGTAGQIIRSGGAAADPAYSTATYPSTAGTSGNVLTSDGTNWLSSPASGGGIGGTVDQFEVVVGGAANAVTSVGPGTAGQVLQSGGAASNPVYSTATYPSTATGTGKILRANGTNWLATTATYPDTAGTSGNVLTSDGTNWVSSTPAGGGFTWSVVTVDATIASNTGVIANKAGVLTMTLPAAPTAGAVIEITGINNATGWKIAQNANQQIFFGTVSTTIGVGGSLQSTATRDAARLVCVVGGASAVWQVISCIGDITYV